ncbi:MAG: ABC transporter permease [Saprospiraceae bacterium]
MFKNYFIIAWRNLVRNKAFTAINILGLALGISACLIIYLITSFELSYDCFHPDKERIYRAVSTMQKQNGDKQYASRVPNPVAATIKKEFTGVEAVTIFHNFYTKVAIPGVDGEIKKFDAAKFGTGSSDIIVTDPAYFKIIQYQWLAGSISSFEEPFNVVLTSSKAHQYFGPIPVGDMIGKKVIYSDSLLLTVSGIVQDYGKNSDFIFNDFISFSSVQNNFLKDQFSLKNWRNWSPLSQTFVKLASGTTTAQFEKQMGLLIKREMEAGPDLQVAITLQPLSDIHYNTLFDDAYGRRTNLPTLYGLMSIAVFILLIAAINFINLSTALSLNRTREIGIRKVLGSRRWALIAQFLIETGILTVCAVVVSLLLTPTLLTGFHSFIPEGVSLHFNTATLFFIIIITIVTGLLAGFYPAKVLSSYLPVISLKGSGKPSGTSKNYFRKGLIVLQFTISLALIIGSLVMGQQIKYVLSTDLGFAKDAVIVIPTYFGYSKEKKELLKDEIGKLTGVHEVSTAIGTPIEKRHSQTWIKCSAISDEQVASEYQTCDENYLALYQIKLIEGKNLTASDTMKEFLINETCAKKLGFNTPKEAIGKIVEIGYSDASSPKRGPIAGVVADFHSQSLHELIAPTFITQSNNFSRVINIKLATKDKQIRNFKQTITQIEKLWKEVYPNDKFEYAFFDDTIAKFYDKEQKTEQVINAAMTIAIFISCMGLFGLATFTAQQRIKEIGIRKVLGARILTIVSILSKDFLKPVAIAIVIACPIAYYCMHQWLQDFAFRISMNWLVFVLAGLAVIFIALITISFQTMKAAMTNPVKSLRNE